MGSFKRVLKTVERGKDKDRKVRSERWTIRYVDGSGKMKWETLPEDIKTKREADAILAGRKAEVTKAKKLGFLRVSRADMTFGELVEDFLVYSREHKRSHQADEVTARNLLMFFGKDRKCQSITRADVEKYIAYRLATPKQRGGGQRKPATVNRERAMLKTMYNRAIEIGYIEWTPMRGVKMLKEDNVRSRVLSPEEFGLLLENSPDYLKPVIQFACKTGMRRGEVLNLCWADVDLRKGWIHLKGENTKTEESRSIPLSDELLTILKQILREQRDQITDIMAQRYIFRRLDKKRKVWVHIGKPRKAFTSACQKAGITDFHFHDLRHCFVTYARRAGYQDRRIKKITGHKTNAVFERYDTVDDIAEENELREIVSRPNCSTVRKKQRG
jgi:integrase